MAPNEYSLVMKYRSVMLWNTYSVERNTAWGGMIPNYKVLLLLLNRNERVCMLFTIRFVILLRQYLTIIIVWVVIVIHSNTFVCDNDLRIHDMMNLRRKHFLHHGKHLKRTNIYGLQIPISISSFFWLMCSLKKEKWSQIIKCCRCS